MTKRYHVDIIIAALKIAVGSSMAIHIATLLNLEYATSAGTIALLTIVTSRKETVRLSFFRILTFIATSFFAWAIFKYVPGDWVPYGIYVFFVVFLCEEIGWKATISVNTVTGSQFLLAHDFSAEFWANELMLVLIGTCIAVIVNFFQDTNGLKNRLTESMRYVENHLQEAFQEISEYLLLEDAEKSVWKNVVSLEDEIQVFLDQAYRYKNNSFYIHADYYVYYFEMRMNQINVIHSLHYELKKIRNMPKQALIVSEYIQYLKDYIVEINVPTEQIRKLEEALGTLKKEQVPQSWKEFENQAMLYHIMMDLEEFLLCKKRFVEALDKHHLEVYWKKQTGNTYINS